MDFQKKVKLRLFLAIFYLLLGAAFIAVHWKGASQNDAFSYFGLIFAVCGITRIRRYYSMRKHPERMKRAEIAENDERNIMIWTKARSLAFAVYVGLAGTAVILLHLLNRTSEAVIVAYTVCAFVLIYWICYQVIRRKY